jgi:hypothetical protein
VTYGQYAFARNRSHCLGGHLPEDGPQG